MIREHPVSVLRPASWCRTKRTSARVRKAITPGTNVVMISSYWKSFGIVVARKDDTASVLWSKWETTISPHDFILQHITLQRFDVPRLSLIESISVQPLTVPTGSMFYMNHEYDSLGENVIK